MILWPWPHTSWWLFHVSFHLNLCPVCCSYLAYRTLLLLFCISFVWSICIPHQYLQQERQSPEAVSRSESAMFPLDQPEPEDIQSSVLFELPVTASSLGSARPVMGLEEELEDSCLCKPEQVLVSGVKSGIWLSTHVELCSLPTSTSGEVRWVLLSADDGQVNHWESGPTFLVRGWLRGQKKDTPPRESLTRECLTRGCLVGKTLVEGKSHVEESDPPEGSGTCMQWDSGSSSDAVGQGSAYGGDALILLQQQWLWLHLCSGKAPWHRIAPGQ